MAISYKPLWHLLVEREMNKEDLKRAANITSNNVSGYRTKRSMQNQDTWDFAQKYSSKISLYMFFPSLILAIVIMPTMISKPIDRIGWIGLGITIIQMMSFIVIMIFTEKALKRTFDESGNKL